MLETGIRLVVDHICGNRGNAEREAVEKMLLYLGRCSLPVVKFEQLASMPETEYVVICGEVDRYALSVSQLLQLWAQLRSGVAINWSELPRAPLK